MKIIQKVRIIYAQDNPQDAGIKNSFIQWLLPGFFTVGAIGGFIMAPVLYFVLKTKT